MTDLSDKIFHNENAARKYLEKQRWPNGVVCPFCENKDHVKALKGKSMGPGWYHCSDCRKKFTVRVGTLYERSHVPLHKWLMATRLLCSAKKGMSSHQLHRTLGVTYKTAWFMSHRIREAMREGDDGYSPMGGEGQTVEVDETYVGGKQKNQAFKKLPPKEIVMSIVERGGNVRSFHVADTTGNTVKFVLRTQIDRASDLMTDKANFYMEVGREFKAHRRVDHSIKEYVRGDDHTQTIESYFGILKRGIMGSYHHVSQAHLKRYLAEFDFRYNFRKVDDTERMDEALKGIEGKRLTYRRTDEISVQ